MFGSGYTVDVCDEQSEGHELAWYATQELGAALELL